MKWKKEILSSSIAILALGGLLFLGRPLEEAAFEEPVRGDVSANEMTLTTTNDSILVFQKAFWRYPQAEDEILHAERREWSNPKEGVKKWQWFLMIRPGPELRAWLESNPFLLASVSPPKPITGFAPSPTWFKTAGDSALRHQSNHEHFTISFSPDYQVVYATDAGFGLDPEVAP
jgi:hypothetical protein